MNFIYNYIVIPIIRILFPFIKIVAPKFRKKEDYLNHTPIAPNLDPTQKTILFHSASMGEFEQAKPVIELINSEKKYNIVCSFYSPSGFDNQKNYKYADYTCYMPFDTKKNAREFIEAINPDVAVFIRYDLWLNHVTELKKRNIPLLLICATKPTTNRLKSYYKSIYNKVDKIMTMSTEDTEYFKKLDVSREVITGADTRFDRIIKVVSEAKENTLIPQSVFENDIVLVAGSSWEPDERIIISAVAKINQDKNLKNIRIVFVPHEPTEEHITTLENQIENTIRFSEIENETDIKKVHDKMASKHLIIDSIGKLLKLYANANIAYIGGAFGAGVHSVTEPAGYGIPVIVGRGYKNSPDARKLVDLEVLKSVSNADELYLYLKKLITDDDFYQSISKQSKEYIFSSKGSSEVAAKLLNKFL